MLKYILLLLLIVSPAYAQDTHPSMPVRVREVDSSPTINLPWEWIVPNGSLTETSSNGARIDFVTTGTIQTTGTVYTNAIETYDTGNVGFGSSNIITTGTIVTTGTGTFGNLVVDTDTLVVNSTSNKVGIGTTVPDGFLHVHGSTAGAVTAPAWADEIIAERGSSGGISILVPNASRGYFNFGAPSDNRGAEISWCLDDDLMEISTNSTGAEIAFESGSAAEAMRIDSTGQVGIGDATPASLFTVGDGDDFRVDSFGRIGMNTAPVSDQLITATLTSVTDSYFIKGTHNFAPSVSGFPSRSGYGYYLLQDIGGSNNSAGSDGIFPRGFKIDSDFGAALSNSGFNEVIGFEADMDFDGSIADTPTFDMYGIKVDAGSDLGTVGSTKHYGGYFRAAGTADANYGLWLDAGDATNNYAIWVADGHVVLDNDSQWIYMGEAQTDYYFGWDGSDATHTITAGDFVFTGGNVGIGTDAPPSLLAAGSSNELTIDGSGALSTSGTINTTGSIILDDDWDAIVIGDGQDLEIYHNGTDSFIENNTGDLKLSAAGGDVDFADDNITSTGSILLNNAGSRVGIGTDAPTNAFHLTTNTIRGFAARIHQDGSNGYGLLINTDGNVVNEPALSITNNTDDLFWVGSDGNIGIGMTTPVAKLDVAGDITTSGTITIGGGQIINRTTVNDANYTVLSGDFLIAYTALSAARTVTLPDVLAVEGRRFCVKDEAGAATTWNIIIDPEGATTIDGAATITLSNDYDFMAVYSDGNSWYTTYY